MHIVLFGGTFDPIHLGHLLTAQAALEMLAADQLLLVPAGVSPHKTGVNSASGADRLAMCRLAVRGDERFAVSDVELQRAGPSYTIDTVTALGHAHAGAEFTWLIGADQLPKLHTWHRVADLLGRVRIAVLGRAGWEMDLAELKKHVPQADISRIRMLATPVVEVSATDIRGRVRAGRAIRWLVPDAAEEYIAQHGLYRA